MPQSIVLVLPTQLFEKHPLIDSSCHVVLVEHPHYFSAFKFCKQKLVLHKASMLNYASVLKKRGCRFTHLEHPCTLKTALKKLNISHAQMLDPVDHTVEDDIKKICSSLRIELEIYETPAFISPTDWLVDELSRGKTYRMQSFYIAQRKRLNVLMNRGKPIGGAWSFDEQNREPLPKNITLPTVRKARTSATVKKAIAWVEKQFPKNYGTTNNFLFPVTHAAAKTWLDNFLKKRFKYFGTYQDAMREGESFIFHSLLSPLLNIGLLTPEYVLRKTLTYAKKHRVPINSVEGFVRQLIGWREFVRGVYVLEGKRQAKANFFKLRKKLPDSFYTASTTLDPVDDVIFRVLEHGYAHHIERLMVLGNIMLLLEISPHQVYRWFMELFVDSYDWVMIPNVYGMSQYADGGLMTTKPYISGSGYIRRMSNYQKGEWCDIWDALFWRFIAKHKKVFEKNARTKVLVYQLNKMDAATRTQHMNTAKNFFTLMRTRM